MCVPAGIRGTQVPGLLGSTGSRDSYIHGPGSAAAGRHASAFITVWRPYFHFKITTTTGYIKLHAA